MTCRSSWASPTGLPSWIWARRSPKACQGTSTTTSVSSKPIWARRMTDMATVMAVKNLVVNYGAVQALKGINVELGEHDIVAVLGANGAGKTTLLKSISRIQTIKGGSITLKGRDLATVQAFRLAGLGIAHVPEGRHVFSTCLL